MEEISLDQIINTLDRYKGYLSEEQVTKLVKIVKQSNHKSNPVVLGETAALASAGEDDSALDLTVELQELIAYVSRLRKDLTTDGKKATPRELKDLILSSSSLFSMLTKLNENFTNQNRLKKIENATIEVIKELDKDTQTAFFTRLEELLHE